jgi:serine/threonine-protein kinase PpkA
MTERDPGGRNRDMPDLPDRWRPLAELPAGRHAQVWIAEDLSLGRQVVLKVFPPCHDAAVRARALVEISLGQRLSHPHLVTLFEVAELDHHLVAVMEYMSGGSLAQRLNFQGPQPVDSVVRWARQSLDVLSYLHEQNLVHRDVKPSNLLLSEDQDLKLADLGLVGRFDRGRYLPATRAALGTPGFMAPEQLHDREPAPSWDLYALGVTVTRLLTGWRPATDRAADAEGATEPRPSLRAAIVDCPLWLEQFVERLLAERPLDRWPSAREALAVFDVQRGS